MEVKWTVSAHRDLVRLYEFFLPVNPRAAKKAVKQLLEEAKLLKSHALLGVELDAYAPRNVRRLIIGDYELRYEVTETTLYVLRLWHSREDLTL
jgi:plasmid stabilization system protein ParE